MAKNFSKLAPLFRGPFLRKVAGCGYVAELVERLSHCDMVEVLHLPLWEILEQVHSTMVEHYRCEYVFKNILTQQWFDSGQSLGPAYITDEFRIGKSRVDLAVFSNASYAFEIKSDFDSMNRIGTQTADYLKVFDFVYVVTSVRLKNLALNAIPGSVGMLVLHDDGALETIRESGSHGHFTDLKIAQDCLRQGEMLSMVRRATGEEISVPNSRVYQECKKRFRRMLPFEAQKLLVEHLRERRYPAANLALLKDAPPSLKHAALTLRASIQEIEGIRYNLTRVPTLPKSKRIKKHEHVLPLPPRQTERIARLA